MQPERTSISTVASSQPPYMQPIPSLFPYNTPFPPIYPPQSYYYPEPVVKPEPTVDIKPLPSADLLKNMIIMVSKLFKLLLSFNLAVSKLEYAN